MIRRLVLSIAALVGVAALAWAFPPFHVVPLDRVRGTRERANFNAAEFAESFWADKLKPASSRAADARAVLEAVDADFEAAREKYGRTVGISHSYYVFIRGAGRVVGVGPKGVDLAIRDAGDGPDVRLPTGMVFGNTLRDATGLLDMDDYPNSQQFNDLSTELNRLVETRVLPRLRERAQVGTRVGFVGCAEVSRDARRRRPLKVIPVSVDFIESGGPRP
jgi:predicted lipoprotein